MSNSKYEIKENEGTLWTSGNECLGRGKIKRKGKEIHAALVKSIKPDGTAQYELMQSCGLIYFNTPEDKKGETSPDFSGKVTLDGNIRASLWENVSDKGTKYMNVKIKDAGDAEVPF
tara:strand:- start:9591 stop:9941 length:351 start_codon:yes stop_codon:yes gene_type:complete